jgi:integrase
MRAGASKTIPGSVSDLIARYLASPQFLSLAGSSQAVYRRQLDRFRHEHGQKPVKLLERRHLVEIIGKMKDRPNAANKLLDRLRTILAFAVDLGMREDNPALGLKGFKVESEGFYTWTDADVAKFEERHPIGSQARLAMALMLYTGSRRSDAVRLGWQHVQGNTIKVYQRKTKTLVELKLHHELKAILDAVPRTNLTFLLTEFGKPFTANGFGNKMRTWCDEAGLPECSSHGLRKAMATRLAEAGATNAQIKSVTGHRSDREVSRYTKAAEQKRLAGSAISLIEAEERTKSAHVKPRLAESDG